MLWGSIIAIATKIAILPIRLNIKTNAVAMRILKPGNGNILINVPIAKPEAIECGVVFWFLKSRISDL